MANELEQELLARAVGPSMRAPTQAERSANLAVDVNPILSEPVMGDMPSGPMGAVAAVSPTMIAGLRARGARTLKTALDNPAFSNDVKLALSSAQQRWPRVFGHLDDIATVPDDRGFLRRMVDTVLLKPITLGSHANKTGSKLSSLEVHPKLGPRQAHGVVAHELTHAAQSLIRPHKFNADYAEQMRKLGYHGNLYELGANKAGAKNIQRYLDSLKGKK